MALKSESVCRFSVSAPKSLVEEFDSNIEKIGYDRSKAIQAAMRSFLNEHKWICEAEGTVAGGLVTVYDHDIRGLDEDLTDVQHRYQSIISSTTHVHLDDRHCLEIIPVKGDAKLVRKLSEEIMTKRGVKQCKLVATILST
jgi:CopG family nickel-responsive transcriptional regulator